MRNSDSTKISIQAISDPDALTKVGEAWNHVVREYEPNPFLLVGLLTRFMTMRSKEGWIPLMLLLSVEGIPVGVAPLMTRKHFGVRVARLLLEQWLSPNFALEDKHRKESLHEILEFVFREMHGNLVELALPSESPNCRLLMEECASRSLRYVVRDRSRAGHRIVPLTQSWDTFRSRLGHDFRRNLKRMSRNMGRVGKCEIQFVDLGKQPCEVEKIHAVESMSWKQEWMQLRGQADEDLKAVVAGSIDLSSTEAKFQVGACFLTLNGLTIAYELILQYQNTAYFTKTSFAEKYRKLSPGVFVINESIRSLCDGGQIRRVDFLTNLPAWNNWPGINASRTNLTITSSGLYLLIDWFMRASTYVRVTIPGMIALLRRLLRSSKSKAHQLSINGSGFTPLTAEKLRSFLTVGGNDAEHSEMCHMTRISLNCSS